MPTEPLELVTCPGSSGGYVMTVVLFAVAICVVPLLGVVSNCIPWLKRRKLNWRPGENSKPTGGRLTRKGSQVTLGVLFLYWMGL